MLSFVWTASAVWEPPAPVVGQHGGSEAFTLGHCRELNSRGIPNQIVTFRLGAADGRELAPDVAFVDYPTPADLPELSGPTILVIESMDLPFRQPPYVMLHNPPYTHITKQRYRKALANRRLIANSQAAARMWAQCLDTPVDRLAVVHPFAAPQFTAEPEPERCDGPRRILFAGRLTYGKGFYTFLEALHFLTGTDLVFTVVLAGSPNPEHHMLASLAMAHPMITAIPLRTPQQMAELLVTQDVLVMPSHSVAWREPFGMLSVEAQHAGCRVVASSVGGLPETDCGGLLLVEPDSPVALARGIRRAARLGRLSPAERQRAATRFTVGQSVDRFLAVLDREPPPYLPQQAGLTGRAPAG